MHSLGVVGGWGWCEGPFSRDTTVLRIYPSPVSRLAPCAPAEGFKISPSVALALDQTQKREREKGLRRNIASQLFGDKGLSFSAPAGSPLLDGTDSVESVAAGGCGEDQRFH